MNILEEDGGLIATIAIWVLLSLLFFFCLASAVIFPFLRASCFSMFFPLFCLFHVVEAIDEFWLVRSRALSVHLYNRAALMMLNSRSPGLSFHFSGFIFDRFRFQFSYSSFTCPIHPGACSSRIRIACLVLYSRLTIDSES